jgi:hypothetical protein
MRVAARARSVVYIMRDGAISLPIVSTGTVDEFGIWFKQLLLRGEMRLALSPMVLRQTTIIHVPLKAGLM